MKMRVNRLIAALFAIVLCFSLFIPRGLNAEAAGENGGKDTGVLELNVYNAEEYISSKSSKKSQPSVSAEK